MKKLTLAYFGSPQFSADFLEKLMTDPTMKQLVEVRLVVTQPDSPVGRKRVLTPTPVKKVALRFENLDIENSLKTENFKLKIREVDMALIYFYGQIIPKKILSLPKYGFWNIHFSLLPKYRGPAPVVWSLISGDTKTGVSIVQADEKLDHGDLITQKEVEIYPQETKIELEKRLSDISFDIFRQELKKLLVGKIKLTSQDHGQATYARFPTRQDGYIPFENFIPHKAGSNSPEKVYKLFRGLYPWPGIWTLLPNGRRLKITDMKLIDGKLIIKKVQLEGKKEVDFATFNKAYKVF